jgi:hypothetical protein
MWFNVTDIMSVASNFIVQGTVGYELSSTYKVRFTHPCHPTRALTPCTY